MLTTSGGSTHEARKAPQSIGSKLGKTGCFSSSRGALISNDHAILAVTAIH